MKKFITRFALLFVSVLFTGSVCFAANKSIGITQIVEHPALDACRKGVEDALAKEGFEVGKNLQISFENAQGEIPNTVAIAKKFAGKKLDAIVAIATPSAQAVAKNAKNTPLVFSAITDPVGAGLVSRLHKPGGNATGVSDLSPIDKHLSLIETLVPKLKSVGVVYNSGEANSVTLVKLLKSAARSAGIKVVEAIATSSSEVLTASRSLVGKVDAIYVPTDNTVVSAFEAVVKVGKDARLPIFAGDTSSVKRGAVAALGFNYYDVGVQTGKIVARILRGERAGSISVETVSKLELAINLSSAKSMGVAIPSLIKALANEIHE